MKEFFYTFIYNPLYNTLVGILDIGGWVDLGIAVIILTILVKLVLFPLSIKAIRTQQLMKELEEPMKEIREKYKNNREEQGRKMLELYREKGVNPFSSFATLLLQLPIIFGLYFVFFKGGFPEVNPDILYSFVPIPDTVPMLFLGFVDMASKSIPLALIAGVTQLIQARYSLPAPKPRGENPTMQEDFARSMQLQMRYTLPVLVGVIAYVASAAVALYLITSNIFAIGQEIYVRKKLGIERGVRKEAEKSKSSTKEEK